MRSFGLKTHIWNNFWKSGLLLAGFPLLLGLTAFGLALIVYDTGGGFSRAWDRALSHFWMFYLAGCGVALIWFLIATAASNRIIDAVTGARPVTRAENPRLWNLLENLAISRGMRMPRLAVIDTEARNAFASGLSLDKGSITVTRGLVQALDDRELAAVLGHELTHIRNGDARLAVIAAIFAGVISLDEPGQRQAILVGFGQQPKFLILLVLLLLARFRPRRVAGRGDDPACIGIGGGAADGVVAQPRIPGGCRRGGTDQRPGRHDLRAAQGCRPFRHP